jgi:glucose-1-phosphate thymidylyltransferase
MKGIILAGGHGTRLSPLTKVTSKQLLPIYNRPMIFYPLEKLLQSGIKEVLIIVAPDNAGDFLNLLGSGNQYGAKFSYEIQDEPKGLAEAFIIGENFIGNDNVSLILGDNIFEADLTNPIQSFKSGGRVLAIEVNDPERFGVVEFDEHGKVISIEEKPSNPKSNFIIPGLYIYDNRVIGFAKELSKSERGEIEIVDLHNKYLSLGELDVEKVDGNWFDAGTFDSLLAAGVWASQNTEKYFKKL